MVEGRHPRFVIGMGEVVLFLADTPIHRSIADQKHIYQIPLLLSLKLTMTAA
jgi:hypothetical protein